MFNDLILSFAIFVSVIFASVTEIILPLL